MLKGSLFRYMDSEKVILEQRNGSGLFQMRLDADKTPIYLNGAIIEDYGNMCYVASIFYVMDSDNLNRVITSNPQEVREKFSPEYKTIHKKVRVFQIKSRNHTDNDYFDLGQSVVSESVKNLEELEVLINTRADFGLTANQNRIIIIAKELYNL